jgi:hypothetical protein
VKVWNSSDDMSYPERAINLIRTTNPDHYTIDELTFTSGEIAEIIASAYIESARQIHILIPDQIDEIEQISIIIPSKLVENLRIAQIDFVMETDHGMVRIPHQSLEGIDSDVWFRFTVTKDPSEILVTQEMIRNSSKVVHFAGEQNKSTVVGRPWNISTNLQESVVDLYIPTREDTWNKRQLHKLKVHKISLDGTIELVDGDIVKTKDHTYMHIQSQQMISLTLILVENKYHWIWWAVFIVLTVILLFIAVSARVQCERYVRKGLHTLAKL